MKRSRLYWIMILAVAAWLLMPAVQARADNVYGSIRGSVTDQSGAVVPGATITVKNAATGITRTSVSGADGGFEVLNLPAPAVYNVTAEKGGFQAYVSADIHLDVNQVFVVNATLEVGQTTQQVTVQANSAQIDTTTMQRGTTVTGQTITALPLNGRNWVQLQQLQPGVVASSDRFTNNYATNGAETQQNSYLVNGVDTNDIALNTPLVIPSPDAIGEFRMITNTIDPEYGRNSGAIINAIIKNGTNQIHGDGFEFYRDTTLDARNFFQKTVAPFHQNQFGATIGGPVLIPHVYDGRNKTFFFFSYQGLRSAVPQAFSVPTVFTQDQRNGIWSGLTTSKGNSAFPLIGDNGVTYPAGTPYSTIFSGGSIPKADINPLAEKLMSQFVPLPNAPGNGFTFNPTTTNLDDQYITRIDENFTSKDTLTGYWLWERHPAGSTLPFTGATLPGFASDQLAHYQEYSLDWDHIISPTAVNEAHFGYLRFNFVSVNPVNPINPTSYGFTGILPQNTRFASLPVVVLTGFFTLGFSNNGPQPRIDQNYVVTDNFSKIVGRHTLKAGFTMERFEEDNPFFSRLSGHFDFGGGGAFTTGLPGADFLLGVPDDYLQGSGAGNDGRSREYYSYFQDQFKLRPNLTLTFGTGWDIETPYLNLFDHGLEAVAFRPGQQSKVFPTAPVGLIYPGDPGDNTAGGATTHYKDFAPRIGFAWSPGGSHNWSIRGGFGLYYNRTEEELALQNLEAPPTGTSSTGVGDIGGSPAFATPFSGWCQPKGSAVPTACSEANKFPFTPPAAGAQVDFTQFEPLGLSITSRNFGVPMSENYNLTIERQLSPSMYIDAAFVGNVAHHLEGAQETNPPGQAPGVNPSAVKLSCNQNNLTTCDPGSFPYNPAIFGSLDQESTDYNSNYNSFQVDLNRSFSHGLYVLASYTWSRYFDYSSSLENDAFNNPGIDPFNWHNMYGPSANDAPQRFVVSYYYTLPIYHFVPHLRPLTDGWSLAGITTFQSGFPIGVYDSLSPSLACNITFTFFACPDRANATGAPLNVGNPRNYALNGKPNYYFNPNAFSVAPASSGFGTAGRNPIYGPGINNWDMSLIKDIYITESKFIELRLETYNTFNQVEFGSPQRNVHNSNFGRITSVITGSTNGSGRVIQLGGKIYF